MKSKLSAINLILILVIFLLLAWGGQSWLQPKFPATVKADGIVPTPRLLNVPTLSRDVYSKAVVREVSRLNLFRKERKKYYRPKPPKPKPQPKLLAKPAPKVVVAPPPKPTAPPPKLVLTGVMLLNGQKVAIFEGTYSEIREGRLTQNLKPHRRGYKIGESFGRYKIEGIDKTHATLTTVGGNPLILKISKTPPNQKIQKMGNRLVQKSKPVLNRIPVKPPARRTRRSQPIPIPKSRLNTIPPSISSLPGLLTPGAKVPAPDLSNQHLRQRLRQRSKGF